jgi:DNA-binding transcriptional ArsR family regulator
MKSSRPNLNLFDLRLTTGTATIANRRTCYSPSPGGEGRDEGGLITNLKTRHQSRSKKFAVILGNYSHARTPRGLPMRIAQSHEPDATKPFVFHHIVFISTARFSVVFTPKNPRFTAYFSFLPQPPFSFLNFLLDMQPFGCILYPQMDAVFKALADAGRRKLLDALHKHNGQTLTELCGQLDMTRQAVTKHLVLLEKANLVATIRRGRTKLHYLNPVPLQEIYERWIGKYERDRLEALSDLKKNLENKQP